jgi:hypothetical protein
MGFMQVEDIQDFIRSTKKNNVNALWIFHLNQQQRLQSQKSHFEYFIWHYVQNKIIFVVF